MAENLKVGDRVRVANPERYIQPWRTRFQKGLKGTVVGFYEANRWTPIRVKFDTTSRVKYLHDWQMSFHEKDLVKLEGDDRAHTDDDSQS